MFEKGILALLKEDHKKVRSLFADLLETHEPHEQQRLRDEIAVELRLHTRIEEEIFYPAVEKMVGEKNDRVLVLQAYEEHDLAEEALQDLLRATPGTSEFRARCQVVAELVNTHADDEEKELFRHVKRAMDRPRLEAMGQEAERRRQELRGDIGSEVRATTASR